MTNHFFDLIRSRQPDLSRPFVETADGTVLTYGDLERRSAQYAAALLALGLQPGDRVEIGRAHV